ncbi:MAG: prolyl oligopeptidase family serine peptidase [Planctomycetota bacterium]
MDGQEYAWSIMIPADVEPGGPAILFLHGYGECGTDGKINRTVGLPPAVQANPERWPFVVIVPQKPVHQSEWEDHNRAVLTMLDEAAESGHYDPGRLAITGLSQGGHGTIMLGGYHAERFRAAAPVCGYVDRRFSEGQELIGEFGAKLTAPSVVAAVDRLKGMPVWLFHGALDGVVPAEESRLLGKGLAMVGADVRYTEYPDADHNAWDEAYGDPALAAWFAEHLD